jgi:glycosyltransferase involved in cell wall biosynthesis
MYNFADCTINVADAEGFGLATFESLACETPIIVTMTGGLQEQVTDGEEWFGIGIEPSSKAIIGSQEIPWIYEDRLNGEEVVDAMEKMYNLSKEEREELGRKGRHHVITNYSREKIMKKWDDLFTNLYNELGSWETRKNYKGWEFKEIV